LIRLPGILLSMRLINFCRKGLYISGIGLGFSKTIFWKKFFKRKKKKIKSQKWKTNLPTFALDIERLFEGAKLIKDTTKHPDVDCEIIMFIIFTIQHFRRQIKGSADSGFGEISSRFQLFADSKIAKFQLEKKFGS